MVRLGLLFGLTAVVFAGLAATISRVAAINYGDFALLGVVMYVAFGIAAGQRLRASRAIISVCIAALIEVSLGSYVAALIAPGRPPPGTGTTELVGLAALTVAFSVACGSFGVAVGRRVAGQTL
jgi:hypothetical protein